jgi:polar amino acid transport system substrate-binding protein
MMLRLRNKLFWLVLIGLVGIAGSALDASAQSTLERARREGLRIGIANEAPYSFIKPDGSLAGADYDLARIIFERIGIKKLEAASVQFGSLIPGLKANRFDVVIAGMAVRPARCEQIAFGEPNMQVTDAVIVKAGNPEKIHSYADVKAKPHVKLGGPVGSATYKNAIDAGVAEDQIVQFPDWSAAVSALRAGRVHGALQSAVAAQTTVREAKDASIEVATPFEPPVVDGKPAINYFAFGFRPEDKDLIEAHNAELKKIIGTKEHLELLDRYALSEAQVPKGMTTAQLCKP